jgi:hypothetical protein
MKVVPVLTHGGEFRFIVRIFLSDEDARMISCQIRTAKNLKIVAFGVNGKQPKTSRDVGLIHECL